MFPLEAKMTKILIIRPMSACPCRISEGIYRVVEGLAAYCERSLFRHREICGNKLVSQYDLR